MIRKLNRQSPCGKMVLPLFLLSSYSALPLGVKWVIAAVAEELPPRNSPFACRGRDRRFRFSNCLKQKEKRDNEHV